MAKQQKKGKNAQKKKRRTSTTRGKAASGLEQQVKNEEPKAELGAGVRARAKGTTMPTSVKVMVGIMAFTMLTMMGAVSYSSMNNFDLLEWVTGADVDGTKSSPTNSEVAMSSSQRQAMDATRKFAGFYVINKDAAAAEKDPQPPVTLAEANTSYSDADTAQIVRDFKKSADEGREKILEGNKEKIQARKDAKAAREEAQRNNPLNKFFAGIVQLRDDVATLVSNTWNGITGANRAEEKPATGEQPDATTTPTEGTAVAPEGTAGTGEAAPASAPEATGEGTVTATENGTTNEGNGASEGTAPNTKAADGTSGGQGQ